MKILIFTAEKSLCILQFFEIRKQSYTIMYKFLAIPVAHCVFVCCTLLLIVDLGKTELANILVAICEM